MDQKTSIEIPKDKKPTGVVETGVLIRKTSIRVSASIGSTHTTKSPGEKIIFFQMNNIN